jgi:hypothetical protein
MPMFSADQVNAAIEKVEAAKREHPVGWRGLEAVGLSPADSYVRYAFMNADLHAERLAREDRRVVYATGWLQGLMVGAALGAGDERA